MSSSSPLYDHAKTGLAVVGAFSIVYKLVKVARGKYENIVVERLRADVAALHQYPPHRASRCAPCYCFVGFGDALTLMLVARACQRQRSAAVRGRRRRLLQRLPQRRASLCACTWCVLQEKHNRVAVARLWTHGGGEHRMAAST